MFIHYFLALFWFSELYKVIKYKELANLYGTCVCKCVNLPDHLYKADPRKLYLYTVTYCESEVATMVVVIAESNNI